MAEAFSWIVTVLGLLGFWLAGKKVWWSWYVNIVNQLAWVVFAVVTDYYAFLVGTAFYFVVFVRNAYLWTKEHFAKPDFSKPIGKVEKINEDCQGIYVKYTIDNQEFLNKMRKAIDGDGKYYRKD